MPTSGPAKQRGPYTKGVARRREIVDTALEVLADRGLGNASLDEISSRVGITRQGLLHYFGTRENLILAVLEERDARDIAAGMAGHRPGEPPEEAYERVLARTREYPGLARLYTAFAAAATDPSHPAHQFFRDRYRRIRNQMREQLDHAVAAGELDADLDTTAASQRLLGVLDGLQLQWLLDPELDTSAALRDAVRDLFAHGP